MAQAASHPLGRSTRRGPARTQLGNNASADHEARLAIQALYRDVLSTFREAERFPDNAGFCAGWIAEHAAGACGITPAKVSATINRILNGRAFGALRGNASRSRYVVRKLLEDPGIESDNGKRIRASVKEQRLRRILEAPDPNRAHRSDNGMYVIASGERGDGSRWKATLYRPRLGARFLALARVRIGQFLRMGEDVGPSSILPDGRELGAVVREWSCQPNRSDGERLIARQFLRLRKASSKID